MQDFVHQPYYPHVLDPKSATLQEGAHTAPVLKTLLLIRCVGFMVGVCEGLGLRMFGAQDRRWRLDI